MPYEARPPSEFLRFTTHLSGVLLSDDKQQVETDFFYIL